MKRLRRLSELPPFEAGLTATLRSAFTLPERCLAADFDEILAKIR